MSQTIDVGLDRIPMSSCTGAIFLGTTMEPGLRRASADGRKLNRPALHKDRSQSPTSKTSQCVCLGVRLTHQRGVCCVRTTRGSTRTPIARAAGHQGPVGNVRTKTFHLGPFQEFRSLRTERIFYSLILPKETPSSRFAVDACLGFSKGPPTSHDTCRLVHMKQVYREYTHDTHETIYHYSDGPDE